MLIKLVLSLALTGLGTSALAGNLIRIPVDGVSAPGEVAPPMPQLPSLQLSATTLDFGSIGLGHSSSPQAVTISNKGAGSLAVQLGGVTSPYVLDSSSCSAALGGGESCSVALRFVPTTLGTSPAAALGITSNGGTGSVQLAGVGVEPLKAVASFTPSSLKFGVVLQGKSESSIVSVTNSGNQALNLGTFAISGSPAFTVSPADTNGCTSSVPVSSYCDLKVTFAPTAGTLQADAVLTVPNDGICAGEACSQVVSLAGTGEAAVGRISIMNLPVDADSGMYVYDFGISEKGVQVPFTPIVVKNTGNGPVKISSIFKPDNLMQTVYTESCYATLQPGATCTIIGYNFSPDLGAYYGVNKIKHDGEGGQTDFIIKGFSDFVNVSLTVDLKDITDKYPSISLGTTANPRTSVTLNYRNNASALPVTHTGGYGIPTDSKLLKVALDTCSGTPLATGQSCRVTVQVLDASLLPKVPSNLVQGNILFRSSTGPTVQNMYPLFTFN